MILATIRRHDDRRFLPGLSSLFLSPSLPFPAASSPSSSSSSFFSDAVSPSARSPSLHPASFHLPLPPLLPPSSERRQVGIRAAVNSPAPLSALMSLLLFALLNAIRAYSVSLPPLLFPGPSHYHVVLSTSLANKWRLTQDARARAQVLDLSLPRLFRAHGVRAAGIYGHACIARGCARNARYRAGGTARA